MCIQKELIQLDINALEKNDIIDYLIEIAAKENKLNDVKMYKEAVLKREEEFSTALGFLVAMPHGQSDAVNSPFVAFARCKDTAKWDNQEVRLIFMIGVPMKNREKTHMKILANISRKLMDEDFREGLLSVETNQEAYELLSKIGTE